MHRRWSMRKPYCMRAGGARNMMPILAGVTNTIGGRSSRPPRSLDAAREDVRLLRAGHQDLDREPLVLAERVGLHLREPHSGHDQAARRRQGAEAERALARADLGVAVAILEEHERSLNVRATFDADRGDAVDEVPFRDARGHGDHDG